MLFEKSMRTLELPRVLAMLADCSVTDEGRERLLQLTPSVERDLVQELLDETTAAVAMLVKSGTPPFHGVRSVKLALMRADKGGSLNIRELLDVAKVLSAARSAKSYGESEEGKSAISGLFRSLAPNRRVEENITNAIANEEALSDAASPELASIRRHMRATESKVREVLQRIIGSNQSKYLQEPIITQRSGRYVVPVKSEHKNDVPGLVHDVSGSGATFFVEPMGVVKANNELRELQAKEQQEIDRILAELSALCAEHREEIETDYDLLIMIDCIFARGKLATDMNALPPTLTDRIIDLKKARHPLLDPKKAVANDMMLGERFDTLVITGPNTGGKTVALKTLGLLVLMAQCGLHLPAKDGSKIKICRRVLADIGDEQSIAQNLSTFSSHMTNIVGMMAQTDDESLILFDELGAGTDPVEGAALAAAIIEHSRKMGALVAATTHYAELKIFAMTTEGVENASCEFDVETLAPTYRLLIGIPGKSNAFAISKRLGLPEHIIATANERVDAEHVRFEEVLTQLDRQRQEMERKTLAAERLRIEAERSAYTAHEFSERLEQERERTMEQARQEAQQVVADARRVYDDVIAELNAMRKQQKKGAVQDENDRRTNLRRTLNETEKALYASDSVAEIPPAMRDAVKGDTVMVLSLGVKATVLDVAKNGTLKLKAGIMNMNAKQEEVRVVEAEKAVARKQTETYQQRAQHEFRARGGSPEVDLRGMMTDEAEAAVDLFIDNAVLARLESCVVIHGKGTGALRTAVHQQLKRHKHVKSFRLGTFGEGENGVTIVTLK